MSRRETDNGISPAASPPGKETGPAPERPVRQVGMRGAAAIQFGSKYLNIAVQLLITAVLARLISPEDFGVLAIVVVFLTFFNMFADMGIGVAIVQFRDLTDRDIGGLFVFSALLSIVLAGVFCAVSPLIAMAYGQDALVPLCCLASLALLFTTLNMVPNGLLLRDKDFVSIGIRLVVTTVVSGGAAIALALAGWGYYALVLQYVISALAVLAWNLVRHPVRGLNWNFMAPLRRVFSYSAFQFGFGFINYFARNLDNILIGGFMGTAALGYYDKAYKLTTYPMTAISSVAASVVQPYMAEHQDDPDRIFDVWMKIQKLISLVAAPIAAVFFCAAPEIIHIMYGDQWDAAIPLFQALSVSVYFQMMNNTSGAFYQSLGRTDLLFATGLVNAAITIAATLFGITTNSVAMLACFISAAYCLGTIPVALLLVVRAFGKPLKTFVVFLPELALGIAACVICLVLAALIPAMGIIDIVWKCICIASIVGVGYKATGQFSKLTNAISLRRG